MSAKKETLGGTIGIVVAVCLVCSIVVSAAAVGLRSQQTANAEADKQSYVLEAAGIEANGDVAGTFASKIEERFVDLATGEYVDKPSAKFDMYKAAKDPQLSSPVEGSNVGFRSRANVANLYVVKDETGKPSRYILPVHGAGLWDLMYAFLAIDTDGNTVKELVYYQQKETPGLGGEVLNPKWKEMWVGKKLFNNGDVAIKVTKNAGTDNPYAVDALSGATLTSNGVQNTLDYWLGEQGFGPFLNTLKKGA